MQTRVYTDKIEIDNNSTKEFWENRANNINNLQTVLLGSDKTGIEQNTRNEHEKLIVESVVKQIQNPRILDIGCGIGRWAENLIKIGRASVGKECVRRCRSRWSPYH